MITMSTLDGSAPADPAAAPPSPAAAPPDAALPGAQRLTADQRLAALHRLGRALADPTRCRLLLALLDGPCTPARLADRLELTRQNVSNHLTCLRECGLVHGGRSGRSVTYELVDPALAHALEDLLGVVWGVAGAHVPPGESTPVPTA